MLYAAFLRRLGLLTDAAERIAFNFERKRRFSEASFVGDWERFRFLAMMTTPGNVKQGGLKFYAISARTTGSAIASKSTPMRGASADTFSRKTFTFGSFSDKG